MVVMLHGSTLGLFVQPFQRPGQQNPARFNAFAPCAEGNPFCAGRKNFTAMRGQILLQSIVENGFGL
jgi:hypothetical protein